MKLTPELEEKIRQTTENLIVARLSNPNFDTSQLTEKSRQRIVDNYLYISTLIHTTPIELE